MSIIIYFQIALMLFLLLATSFTDLKYGKVWNKTLVAFSSIGILLNLILFIKCGFLEYKYWLYCVFIYLLISVGFYLLDIWAAGDSKLVISYILLFPGLLFEGFNIYMLFPLLLSFILAYLFIIFDTIKCFVLEKRMRVNISNIKTLILNYLLTIVYIVFANEIISVICNYVCDLPQWLSLIALYFCIFVLYSLHWFRSKFAIVSFIVVDLLMIIVQKDITPLLNWKTYLVVVVFLILKLFVEQYNYEEIDIAQLKAGDILSTNDSLRVAALNDVPLDISDESLKSRLSEEKVTEIINSKYIMNRINRVSIVKKIPFAIFISIGFLFVSIWMVI